VYSLLYVILSVGIVRYAQACVLPSINYNVVCRDICFIVDSNKRVQKIIYETKDTLFSEIIRSQKIKSIAHLKF
jgi:hypothetical protein